MLKQADIWIPLHIGAYLGKTLHLSTLEHGAYFLILLAYWKNGGPLPDDDISLANIAKVSQSDWNSMRPRLTPFFTIENGVWSQDRANRELAKAKAQKEARKTASKAGNEARWSKSQTDRKRIANGVPNVSQNGPSSPSPSPLAGEREESAPKHTPKLSDVLAYAFQIGLSEWKATDWFNEMEGCGWLDFQHRKIDKWQAVIARVKVKWEADGRPAGPPTSAASKKDSKRDSLINFDPRAVDEANRQREAADRAFVEQSRKRKTGP